MKHLYDSLHLCAKEEEVKAEFCKFFKMKIFALRTAHKALVAQIALKLYEYGFLKR